MSRTLEYRRDREKISKIRAIRKIKADKFEIEGKTTDRSDDKVFIGKMASTHGALCSCSMCGNPRRRFKEITKQEKKSNEDLREQIKENL